MSEFDPPKLPPDAEELLNDPQLADLRYRGPNIPKAGKALRPADPPALGESRFLLFRDDFEYAQVGKLTWMNQPTPRGALGAGRGFPTLQREVPRFMMDRPKPAQVEDAWTYGEWLIASRRFVEIVMSYDPAPIETVNIDWSYADGRRLDGYAFVDVRRLLHAYDYRRSVVFVEIDDTRKYISSVGAPRALRPDLPADAHIFRDAYWRQQLFFSRELAKALVQAGIMKGFYFEDPASVGAVKF